MFRRTLTTMLVASLALLSLAPLGSAVGDCQRFAFIGDPSGGGVICYNADTGGADVTGRATICFDSGECYWVVSITSVPGGANTTVCYLDANGNVTCTTIV